MGLDINKDFLEKQEWINNIKFISPRPRYNHIELKQERDFVPLKDSRQTVHKL